MATTEAVIVQPGVQTTVVIGQPGKQQREWGSGLFQCFEDMETCILGTLCPEVLCCCISMKMDEGLLYPICCGEIAPFTLRAKIRTENGIQGSLCDDAVSIACCYPCSLCQMARELKSVGKW